MSNKRTYAEKKELFLKVTVWILAGLMVFGGGVATILAYLL